MASGSSEKLKLYSYWQSSCSQRVRFALNLKGLEYEYKAVNLLKGEQFSPDFAKVNPVKFVPALVDGDAVVSDSLAIILYLEDKYPGHPLLPRDLAKRALNYQITSIVASTIQPLHNLQVLKIIEEKLDAEQKLEWAKQHVGKGFTAIEKLLEGQKGKYATGDEVFLADVFLAPQLYAGIRRFALDMSPFPILVGLYEAYKELPAFQASLPQAQPDAPANL